MKLLGQCPNCGMEDTIHDFWKETGKREDCHKIKCDACGMIWEDWMNLVYAEKEKGNKLIPVEIERVRNETTGEEYGVKLFPPKDRIPSSNLVVTVLNAALMTKFNLRVCFACEGGVEGCYGKSYIELRNLDNELGLSVDSDYVQTEVLKEVLDFYEEMLRILFVKEFNLYKRKYKAGEILKIEAKDEDERWKKTWRILLAMLIKVKSKKFAEKVVETIEKVSQNPFSAPYIRGLTSEEIVKFFVPPP